MTDVQMRAAGEDAHEEPTGADNLPTRRRTVLAGAGALGAACLLAACGTDNSGGGNPNGSDFEANPAPAGSKGADAGGTGNSTGGATGQTLVAVADVPEGGGVIKGDYVITQPEKGTFKAFSKKCTHQGCDVNKVDAGLIQCPCHGSKFAIEDGAVKDGPATSPLPPAKVKVDGDNIVTA